MKFVHASAQLISVLLLTQHTLPFVHGVPSATYISTENEDSDYAVSNTILFSISCKNWIQERSKFIVSFFLSFNQERFDCRFARPFFLFYSSSPSSSIAPFISTDTCSIFLNIFLNPLSIPSHRPKPTVPPLFLIRIILSIMSGQEIMIPFMPLLSQIPL